MITPYPTTSRPSTARPAAGSSTSLSPTTVTSIPDVLQRYVATGSHPVIIDKKEVSQAGATLILSDIINKENSATHDTKKLANVLFDLINALRTDLSPELLHYYLKRYTFTHR